jgi:flagellar capping protein FliD
MASALNNLTGSNAVLQGQTSDNDVATVQINNSRTIASMPPRDTTVNVEQIATAQVNQSDALTSSLRNVDADNFTFEIQSGNRTHTFNITVGENDTNAIIQRRMAEAINTRDIGVRAAVASGVEDGAATTTLTLTGTQTGAVNAFEVRDVTGNLAAAMQLDSVTTEAQNAIFTINGDTRETASNEVNIAAGVNLTLTGEGEANITFGRTTAQSISAMRDLVSSINSAIRGTNPNHGRGSQRLVNDLIGANISFESSLARIGINVQQNGQLSINEDQLQAAAADGRLDQFF